MNKTEEQVMLDVPFFIGPVPMKLEVGAVLNYGITGSVDLAGSPGALAKSETPEPIASVSVAATPTAGVHVSMFVGAGVGCCVAR